VHQFEYYTEKDYQAAPDASYFRYGLPQFRNKHMLKAVLNPRNNNIYHYYTFDADNKVIADSVYSTFSRTSNHTFYRYEWK